MTWAFNNGNDVIAATIGAAPLIHLLPDIASVFTIGYYILRAIFWLRDRCKDKT